jgi:hypothetical protein
VFCHLDLPARLSPSHSLIQPTMRNLLAAFWVHTQQGNEESEYMLVKESDPFELHPRQAVHTLPCPVENSFWSDVNKSDQFTVGQPTKWSQQGMGLVMNIGLRPNQVPMTESCLAPLANGGMTHTSSYL